MDPIIIMLLVLHSSAGMLWVGGAIFFYFCVAPNIKTTSPISRTFMEYLMARQRFSQFMTVVSILTILAGVAMYFRDPAG